jgi:hypothetical protein
MTTKPVTQTNKFSLGAQIGGPDTPSYVLNQQQQLRDAFNQWTGAYCSAIREFAFILRVDGSLDRYTELWNIRGAQSAKRKGDWVEVEIGVPEDWWKADEGKIFKNHLVGAVETGLHSMIELLRRNKHSVDDKTLLKDWARIKSAYLAKSEDHLH